MVFSYGVKILKGRRDLRPLTRALGGILTFVLSMTCVDSHAQVDLILDGWVKQHSGEGIGYAHIISIRTQMATAADPSGKFLFLTYPGDSLIVTAMGFHTAVLEVPDISKPGRYPITVILIPDTLQLAEVIITPWPRTWEAFRQAFLHLDLPDENVETHITPDMIARAVKGARPQGGIIIPGPVSLLYNAFSKEAKSMRKYQTLTGRDDRVERIRKRVGDPVLLHLTQTQDILDAIWKLEHCTIEDIDLETALITDIVDALLACLSTKENTTPALKRL